MQLARETYPADPAAEPCYHRFPRTGGACGHCTTEIAGGACWRGRMAARGARAAGGEAGGVLNSASFETRRFDTLDPKEAKVLLDARWRHEDAHACEGSALELRLMAGRRASGSAFMADWVIPVA